jgi:signal transduction histidine kinase
VKTDLRDELRAIAAGLSVAERDAIGHELNNPLAAVLGNVDFALEAARAAALDDAVAALDDALDALVRLRDRIRILTGGGE